MNNDNRRSLALLELLLIVGIATLLIAYARPTPAPLVHREFEGIAAADRTLVDAGADFIRALFSPGCNLATTLTT